MKAIYYEKYGSPDVLEVREIEKPVPKDNEILIEVRAASINSWEWDLVRGKPYIIRIWGLFKPKYKTPGADIAGQVVAIGSRVKKFKVGDAVLGDLCASGWGGFAQYVCAPENALIKKPDNISFEHAASLPQAGVMALQSVRDMRFIKPGEQVLINGAGGGVGTFALQIAKTFGAEVTCVDSAAKLDMLRALGADHVIDFRKNNFTQNRLRYDLIIDVVANRSIFEYKRALNPNGNFVLIGGTPKSIIQAMFIGPMIGRKTGKKLKILSHEPNKNLHILLEMIQSKKLNPVIDKVYPLNKTSEALQKLGEGDAIGKVIISIPQ